MMAKHSVTFPMVQRLVERGFWAVLKQLIVGICVGCFIAATYWELKAYSEHPTFTSSEFVAISDLEFPAVSICDNHFKYGEISSDLNFPPPFPFVRDLSKVMIYPETVYDKLFSFGGNVSFFINNYYFSITDMLFKCQIGGMDCKPPTNGESQPQPQSMAVSGGWWISTLMADSDKGTNFMCHTLYSNVTMSLNTENGNSLLMAWKRDVFSGRSNFWSIYVHDRHETVLLETYRMGNMPVFHFTKAKTSGGSDAKLKAQLGVKKLLNEKTKHHPCEESDSYSLNTCKVVHAWKQRFKKMKTFYQEDFRCQIPGIDALDLALPVCDIFQKTNIDEPLGLIDLVNPSSDIVTKFNYSDKLKTDHLDYTLAKPPIGSELTSGLCQERCSSFSYSLALKNIGQRDELMYDFDVHLYFGSNMVELWTRRETITFLSMLSNVGGMLGLLLGASVMATLTSLVQSCHAIWKQSK
ncbi:uncharacterized protein LOC131891059 [Tigriopus californicus]|uniref:uncharacterized protein LOC131891059 n=1 Tax=Tigriopus californicus TaxID=6832 RepID=UPI0027DA0F50|nr:uncharacterized protein LOC131891059 [Tigriopus californicus]